MSGKRRIFVSYSHQDQDWCDMLAAQLKAVHDPLEFDVWIDSLKIRVGDRWHPGIDKGLNEADLAVLLISANFLSSPFIRDHEQKRLLARRDAGLLVVPVLVGACAWRQIDWLSATELRPRGGQPLEEIGKPTSPKVKKLAAEVVDEITTLLKSQVTADPQVLAQALVRRVLLADLDAASAGDLAQKLVAKVAQFSGLGGAPLLRAVRLFVEFHLLRSDKPTSPQALLQSLELMPGDKTAKKLLNELKRGAGTGDYGQCVIDVSSMFFMLSREREALWQAYFEWLQQQPATPGGEEISSLATVNVLYGFIAPQFLVAGLMSRFDDDWRPVLSTYARSVPDPNLPGRGFESLQASQWNLWLVWGPSIPICRCTQWRGLFAFQYGYGDENNSLPLLELEEDAQHQPKTLDPLARQLLRDSRGAAPVKLTGRLRWGPQFLRGAEVAADVAEVADAGLVDTLPDDGDDPDLPPARPVSKWLMADAQAALFCGNELVHSHHSEDGLILQLRKLEETSSEPRAYFSAYLWMMFLVAGPLAGGDDTGPHLLRRRFYPPWPDSPGQREPVRKAALWRNLLPIFVHANIADPTALRIQRRMLIHSALAMLRQLWVDRQTCFDADDVRAGIRFHLVCASDYTGCGEPVRYPTDETLSDLMRQALQQEADQEFAATVVVPAADETAAQRPWGLMGYFSSCHLPELVLDYFDHIAQLQPKPGRRP